MFALRCPDGKRRSSSYPRSHNGLPEPEYNKGLAEFDHAVHQCIDNGGDALVVLVETFAKRRIYFSYVRPDSNVETRLAALANKYPQHAIEVGPLRSDPDWEAYGHYRKTFPW